MATWISIKQVQVPFLKFGTCLTLIFTHLPSQCEHIFNIWITPPQGNAEKQETSTHTHTDLDPTKHIPHVIFALRIIPWFQQFPHGPPLPHLSGPPWRAPSSWYRIHKQEKQIDKRTCDSVVVFPPEVLMWKLKVRWYPSTRMSQEVDGSVGYNPNISHL